MKQHQHVALVVALVLSACAAPPTGGGKSSTPSTTSTTASKGPWTELPTKVGLALPGSVGIVAQGAGNIVAQGGGNYHPLAASLAENVVVALIKLNVLPYIVSTLTIEKILTGLNLGYKAGVIKPGEPFTFRDDDNADLTAAQKELPENKLTAVLTLAPDRAHVAIYQGSAVDPARQVAALKFTSKTRGTAVFRPVRPGKDGKTALATTFDLEANTASADAYGDKRDLAKPEGQSRIHWEFAGVPGAKKDALAFKLRLSAYAKNPPTEDRLVEASANFTSDGGGAAIVGIQPAEDQAKLGDALEWFPNDGTLPRFGQDKAHDLYMNPKGLALDGPQAPAAYKAMLPADGEVYKPYVKDPSLADPLAEPVFAFPQP